jgi:hypothetical protein
VGHMPRDSIGALHHPHHHIRMIGVHQEDGKEAWV